MDRPVTSSVSALSSSVANGHQALHHVSSRPSKIPYGGFSPVRLQTGLGQSPSPSGKRPTTYRRPESCSPANTGIPAKGNHRANAAWDRESPELSGPEALGSPAGYSVPPGRCLLWPHPRLQTSPDDLLFFVVGSLPCGQGLEIPCFNLPVLLSVPSAVPRRIGR